MNHRSIILAIGLALAGPGTFAANGPAGTGACAHVFGPIDVNGNTIGFTCEDVGGSALLVWNASQQTSNLTITGGIRALNFSPGPLSIDGTIKSNGPLGFVANGLTINGNIIGSSILIAGLATTDMELRSTLFGPSGRMIASNTSSVNIATSGKVTATTGDITIAGSLIHNAGKISALKGTASLTVGTKLDVGWSDVAWLEGIQTKASGRTPILNDGTITAANVKLEAHRKGTFVQTILNSGTICASNTITFITGEPGFTLGNGSYVSGSFGIENRGTICAAKVVISPYFQPQSGGPPMDRSFDLTKAADKKQLHTDIDGKIVFPSTDNHFTNSPDITAGPSAVIDNTGAFTSTSSLVIPQLAASMSHLNATQQATVRPHAVTSTNEQLRGEGKRVASTSTKPRPKAKAVLVRGAFFDSKISVTLNNR